MKAKCFCPKHGKQELDQILIRDRIPICKTCKSKLEFGEVRPRKVESPRSKK